MDFFDRETAVEGRGVMMTTALFEVWGAMKMPPFEGRAGAPQRCRRLKGLPR